MSDFEKYRQKIEDLKTIASEQNAAREVQERELKSIEEERESRYRWLKEEADRLAEDAVDILGQELDPVSVFHDARNVFFESKGTVDTGKLYYVPEYSYDTSSGDKGNTQSSSSHTRYPHWGRRVTIFGNEPQYMISLLIGAQVPWSARDRGIGVGYCLQGIYLNEKSKEWDKIAHYKHESQKVRGFGEFEFAWGKTPILAFESIRMITSEQYFWTEDFQFSGLRFGRSKIWGTSINWKAIPLNETASDFKDSVGECAYHLVAGLKGVNP